MPHNGERYYISGQCSVRLHECTVEVIDGSGHSYFLAENPSMILLFFFDHEGEYHAADEILKTIWGKVEHHYTDDSAYIQQQLKPSKGIPVELRKCIVSLKPYGYIFRLPEQPSLRHVDRNAADLRIGPLAPCANYTPPGELNELLRDAFSETRVHAISGERGLGKSELARAFCRETAARSDLRPELRFQSYIFTAYDYDLRSTVAGIKAAGLDGFSDPYTARLALLREMKKPCLIVIDNYDDEEDYHEQLSGSCQEYLDLLDTGCDILFTTMIDLTGCYQVRQTVLRPADVDTLRRLFCKTAGELPPGTSDEAVEHLIRDTLACNTYLTVLAARLMNTVSPEDIIRAFEDMDVSALEDPVAGEKDGSSGSSLLIEHLTKLFRLSAIDDDPTAMQILFNLALLPVTGMPYKAFLDQAFPTETHGQIKAALRHLVDIRWAFLRSHTVSLHPAVRDLIAEKLPAYRFELVRQSVASCCDRIHVQNYSDEMYRELVPAQAAYRFLRKKGDKNALIAFLLANLASDYETVKQFDPAVRYGAEAICMLDALPLESLPRDERAMCANSYTMAAYAVLRSDKPEHHALANDALERAKTLLDELISTCTVDDERRALERTQTIFHGNMAAYMQRMGDYWRALAYHEKAMSFRRKLCEADPSNKNRSLLAAAYRGLGTDHYYLAGNGESKWEISCRYHRAAVDIYEQTLGADNLDTAISVNRWCDAELMKMRQTAPSSGDTSKILRRLRAAGEIFAQTPTENEVQILFRNMAELRSLLDQHDRLTEEIETALQDIVNLFCGEGSSQPDESLLPYIREITRSPDRLVPR